MLLRTVEHKESRKERTCEKSGGVPIPIYVSDYDLEFGVKKRLVCA